jgi:hypothetical protein
MGEVSWSPFQLAKAATADVFCTVAGLASPHP